jgi:hypothetical protein
MTFPPRAHYHLSEYSSGTSHGIPSPLPITRSVDMAPMMTTVPFLRLPELVQRELDDHWRAP